MRARVHFHGYMKELVPEPIEVEAEDVRGAIEGVTRQLPQLAPEAIRGRHRLTVVGCPTVEDLRRTDMEDIHLVPQFSGGKRGGFLQIVIGAALIAASFAVPGAHLATWKSMALFNIGTAMVLGGVMQLIAPAPKRDQATGDPEASKYLGAPGNTTASGTRVPMLYGRDMVYGHYLSFNISAKDVAV